MTKPRIIVFAKTPKSPPTDPDVVWVDLKAKAIHRGDRCWRAGASAMLGGNGRRVVFDMAVALLVGGNRYVSSDDLVASAWADDPGGGPLCAYNYVKTTVHRLRRHFAILGIEICRAYYTRGYSVKVHPTDEH